MILFVCLYNVLVCWFCTTKKRH